LRGSGRFSRRWSPTAARGRTVRFNPLHCGAVVASRRRRSIVEEESKVSIPFIAGQWSLRPTRTRKRRNRGLVSIPFIAGQWSLRSAGPRSSAPRSPVSIPFIAGQWSLREHASTSREGCRHVSIPFIAGQWSLPAAVWRAWRAESCVSIPFIAGQWSLPLPAEGGRGFGEEFQSPSLRGSGRFISSGAATSTTWSRFNPLHCGAVVASRGQLCA